MSQDVLSQALAALQQGDAQLARRLTAQVLLKDPSDEQAWLLMARLSTSREQVTQCLERALRINPFNRNTQAALWAVLHQPVGGEPAAASAGTTQAPAAPALAGSRTVNQQPGIASPLIFVPPDTNGETYRPPRRKINLSLILGSMIVLVILIIAVIGPQLAPQDPLAEHAILQVSDKWVIPPFNAFQVPGYFLGSDQFGRDMLSRILYAVRPTLLMVTLVAIVRLLLGTWMGLVAGWSSGRLGRLLDGLITAALAIPVLMIALGAITMLGTEGGLLPFIIGLSLTGWGETARIVREQTQVIKGQLYIESARSIGSSSFQVLTRHILRQMMPVVWMLFAFEISGTLMVTAGLGFLGYYIGGDVWIEVADFVSRRTSGAPELGQMLATSWVNLLQPWPLVLTGSVIFITVLGFNLLGDGLRLRLSPEYINRNSLLERLKLRFGLWFDQSVSYPAANWFRANRLRQAMAALLVMVLFSSLYLYQTRVANRFDASQVMLKPPGGQTWASERIDPYGTKFFNARGPQEPRSLWEFHNPAGFSGSPVVAADGTVYLASLDGILTALDPAGNTLWTNDLPAAPLGPLSLDGSGNIYVTDTQGGISAFEPHGGLLWTHPVDTFGKPTHGAIIAPDGNIYYLLADPRGDTLIALDATGKLRWSVKPGTDNADTALRLSADGTQLYLKSVVLNVADGSLVDLTLPTSGSPILSSQAQLFTGVEGKSYLLAGHIVMQWTETEQGFTLGKTADWNYRSAGFTPNSGFPTDAGVTPKGNIWIFYTGFYGGTSLYWLDPSGRILGNMGVDYTQDTHLIAIDKADIAYVCGLGFHTEQGPALACDAYRQDSPDPLWSYNFPQPVFGFTGAAMAPGRLYVLTVDGTLSALGDSTLPGASPSPTP